MAMSKKTQTIITTAGSNAPITLFQPYDNMSIATNWPKVATVSYSTKPIISIYDEIHTWRESFNFNPYSQIDSMEVMSELILDALKTDGWTERRGYIESEYPETDKRRYFGYKNREYIDVFSRDGLYITVKPDAILFSGKGAHFINRNADIVSNEDTLLAFLDWIYEGGNCPIMNNTINRLVKRFNTYPTSNDHLTRKNNRKK